MTDFTLFSQTVHRWFNAMADAGELYVSHFSGEQVWDAYLAAFPEGTNPIFRERTEHDCSCCRNFIKNIGNVVAVIDGAVHSVWGDWNELPEPYRTVGQTLSEMIEGHPEPIAGLYRTQANLVQFGAEKSYEQVEGQGPITWHHLHGRVPAKFVVAGPAQVVGDYRTSVEMFKRALTEIKVEAVSTVLGLIRDNNLYRGEEKLRLVAQFEEAQRQFSQQSHQEREVLLWTNGSLPAARIRNDVIGTLLVDLSEGVPLERAVASFENKVSGTNYKRPKALITQAMVDKAMATIEELGVETALQRRHAKISDITVNNVIWADRSAAQRMKGGLAGLLSDQVQPARDNAQATDISIQDFLASVVPECTSIEALLTAGQQGNLMSLTAPAVEDGTRLFKWDNNFAWSYNGNIADSIKEKVKRAGGNTGAALRVSLAWFNGDDLDIAAHGPEGHIYFGSKKGILDVDMNALRVHNAVDPVENLSWSNPRDGRYTIVVNQFNQRSRDNGGFVLEVENNGVVTQYSHKQILTSKIEALNFTVKGGKITELTAANTLVGGGLATEVWGIKTETYVPVETLLYSPNHWDEQTIGNKHWFFILKGCKNPEPCRGIYNEFLRNELSQHGKVFEVLGGKTLCPVADEQLSGVGFSSTKRETLKVRVQHGSHRKVFNIHF